jgi:hypothetical protein
MTKRSISRQRQITIAQRMVVEVMWNHFLSSNFFGGDGTWQRSGPSMLRLVHSVLNDVGTHIFWRKIIHQRRKSFKY